LDYTELTLRTTDRIELPVWYIPGDLPVTVIFFHGNAGNISYEQETYRILHDLGMSIITCEYRGYAGIGGRPAEQAISSDLAALSEWLREQPQLKDQTVIVLGRSLGGAIAAKLAAIHRIDGLILESTFTSMAAMARRTFPWLPVGLLLRDKYATIDIVDRIEAPILVIHSPEDSLIPFSMGLELSQRAGARSNLVEIRGGHANGFLLSEGSYRAAISEFIESLTTTKAERSP
jgi:hypothetical protein